ncbi:GAF and ANTAR domain-containing protein [uncultured Jatrophihabitans sp.]|uniref:GAF and ANTAR domain-containing protein n=1 Tax=uncultured Jatrophihabitans sp. TaxID=1610747 RepID=UPI0035CBB14A
MSEHSAEFDRQTGRAVPPDQGLTQAQSDSDDQDVTTAVQGLAGLVADVDELEQVLAQIADLVVLAVPGSDGAGVTVVRAGDGPPVVLAWAVTAAFVREIDHLQYDICGEGPCLTAMRTGRILVSGSLGSDDRWPRFGGRAARLQVHSALSIPLLVRGTVVGALNIYARKRDAFTEHAVRLAEQFAAPAGITVGNIQVLHAAHARATQLQAALTNRAVIDQAIGILRSRSGGSSEEAFDRLRQTSQGENVKLADIAQRLVDEAVRRAHARHARSDNS